MESNGFVSIEAAHFTRNISSSDLKWKEIKGLGRTYSGMKVFPVYSAPKIPGKNSPCLEYDVFLFHGEKVNVNLFLSPTLDYFNDGGTKLAVSFDDEEPVILSMNKIDKLRTWEGWVSNNINLLKWTCQLTKTGKHTLKVWMVDQGVVLQKITIDGGGLKPSYLGPTESKRIH
jgi:hypothetical protein